MNPSTAIRLIAIDLDGTLLTPDFIVHPRTVAAIRAATDRGVTVTIATGRMHSSAEPYARELDLRAPMVTYNGAMIRHVDVPEPLWELPVPADLATDVVELCVRERWDMTYFLDDRLYVPRYDHWAHAYLARTGNQAVIFGDLRRMAGREPTKLLVNGTPEQTRERHEILSERYAGRLHSTISLPEYVELMHPDVSKASALARLAGMLGIEMAEVMAIGDALNDLEMVEAAGVGVMMATAAEGLRAAADFVPQSVEAGVAEAIESLVLGSYGQAHERAQD